MTRDFFIACFSGEVSFFVVKTGMSYLLEQFILRNILSLKDVSRLLAYKAVSGLLRYKFDIKVKLVLFLIIVFFPPFCFLFLPLLFLNG